MNAKDSIDINSLLDLEFIEFLLTRRGLKKYSHDTEPLRDSR